MTSSSATDQVARDVRLKADIAVDHTFRASHFFVLASLLAATAAVIASRQSSPAHLVLVSLTIGAAGLAAAGFYRMLAPLVGDLPAMSSAAVSGRARPILEREKLLTMRALKDLEFDRSMGKLSQADFDEMSARLRLRAMALIKQLDEDGSGYRSLIERELTARIAGPAAPADAAASPAAAVEDASVAAEIAGACACGTSNDPDAVFCKRCGSRLSPAAGLP